MTYRANKNKKTRRGVGGTFQREGICVCVCVCVYIYIYIYTYILIADSCGCTAKTNITYKATIPQKKEKKFF